VHIEHVHVNAFFVSSRLSSHGLPESGQSGLNGQQFFQMGPITHSLRLANRSGAHKSEIAHQDGKELRKLVEAKPPKKPTNFRNAWVINELMLLAKTGAQRRIRFQNVVRVYEHGSKFHVIAGASILSQVRAS